MADVEIALRRGSPVETSAVRQKRLPESAGEIAAHGAALHIISETVRGIAGGHLVGIVNMQ